MAISFTIERRGRAYRARADGGPLFFIGNQTSYADRSSGEDFEGLFNVPSSDLPTLVYDPAAARPTFGFWADLIAPTALCEGGNFLTLNTYDRARFTWGFGQFGAHVPNGDFVGFFRDLLGRPEAVDYFPNLRIKDGRITKISGSGSVFLETDADTSALMDFLNPTSAAVEDAEVVAAAKLIHWTTQVSAARDLQSLHMVKTFRRLMLEADIRLNLAGRTADICCVICDIRHQGRAKFPAMQAALGTNHPLVELLKLGSIAYPERIRTLRKAIANAGPLFTGKSWDRQSGEFV